MKVPVPLFSIRPAYTKQLGSKQLVYARCTPNTEYVNYQSVLSHTFMHKSKLVAEKFCSIPVEGSTLCKHHKQLHQVSVYCVEF